MALEAKARILLVEAGDRLPPTLTLKLLQLDVVVDHAIDFQGAIAKLLRNDYDLVFCGSSMRDNGPVGQMHGGHIARWVRETSLGVPVHFTRSLTEVIAVTQKHLELHSAA